MVLREKRAVKDSDEDKILSLMNYYSKHSRPPKNTGAGDLTYQQGLFANDLVLAMDN